MTVMKIKKQKTQKCVTKKFKFENYQSCLKATLLEIKRNYLQKNEINIILKKIS